MQQFQICQVCRSEIRVTAEGGGFVAVCGCGAGQVCGARKSAYRSLRRATAAGRQATGEGDDTVEARARHIADKIGEAADSFKIKPCDLTWHDFRAYGDIAWGNSSLGIVRRDITRLGGFNAIRDTYYPPEPTAHAEARFEIRQHAALNRKLGVTAVSDEQHFKRMEEWAAKVFNAREPAKAPAFLKRGRGDEIERELILLLGDQHIGANINGRQTGGPDYGPVEEARSHAQCVRRLLDWKPEHRKKTGLTVVWLGDLHDGDIHDPRSRAEMWEQKCRAIWVGTSFVERVAPEFLHVRNHCYSGNHDRDTNRHPERATSAKYDSHATVAYFAMKQATKGYQNVSWDIPMAAFSTFEIFGSWYYATHGDTDLHTGNPGQGIPVGRLNAEANEINARLTPEKRISVFFAAHAHTYANARLGAGAEIFVNGPMTPLNSYAHSISVYHGNSSQTMIEAVPGHPVGDRCPIDLDEKVYRDKSLDRLIQPFKEF
jgi:hypothetical protein